MINTIRWYQLLLHSWGLLWLYVRRCDLWLLLLFLKGSSIVLTCSYIWFLDSLNYLMLTVLGNHLLFIRIMIVCGDYELRRLLSCASPCCIATNVCWSLIEPSCVWFWILGLLKMWGVLLRFELLTSCGLRWYRLTSVISVLLQSCTIFASSLSRGCLQITIPRFPVSLHRDHQRLLHLLLLLCLLTLWDGKLLRDPWARLLGSGFR